MENYEIIKLLGKGAYGRAVLCRELKLDRLVVIKQVVSISEDQLEEARREAEILGQLEHPNVVALYGSFVDTTQLEGSCLHIVMEYADSGDLDAAIKRRKSLGKAFEELHVMRIFVQLTLALEYIHARRILHRDIKPQNVFLTSDGCVKLGDFGVAKSLSQSASMAHTQLGTPYYLSPEIFNDENYDASSDMWSLGVLTFELVTLTLPFQAGSLGKLAVRVMRDEPPLPACSVELQDMLMQLLAKKAEDRPTAKDLLKFDFFRLHAKRLLEHASATGLGGLEEDIDSDPNGGGCSEGENSARNSARDSARDRGDNSAKNSARGDNSAKSSARDGPPSEDGALVSARIAEMLTTTPPTAPPRGSRDFDAAGDDGDGVASRRSSNDEGQQQQQKNPFARHRGSGSGSESNGNPFARKKHPENSVGSNGASASSASSGSPPPPFLSRKQREPEPDIDSSLGIDSSTGSKQYAENGEVVVGVAPGLPDHLAAQCIQRSWRNLANATPTARVPALRRRGRPGAGRHPEPSGDSTPKSSRTHHAAKKTPAKSRQSVKDSLARAAELGAAKRAKAAEVEKAQRKQRCEERGEELDPPDGGFTMEHSTVRECDESASPDRPTRRGSGDAGSLLENTVVVQLTTHAVPDRSPDKRNSNEFSHADGWDASTNLGSTHANFSSNRNSAASPVLGVSPDERPSAEWRVRDHLTQAAQRGLARKATAEEKAAQNQRELENKYGTSRYLRSPVDGGPSSGSTPTGRSRGGRRNWDDAKWVPQLPTLAASTVGLDNAQIAAEVQGLGSGPNPAGPAGRAVNAARSARGGNRRTPREPRYRTKSSSKALQNSLASMLGEQLG